MPIAFEVLASHLLTNADEVLPAWLPNGRKQGREWCVGSLDGQAGQSLKINIDSGRWSDFATGQKGGDLIALYAAMHGLSQTDAAKQLGAEQDQPAPVRANGHQAPPPRGAPYEPEDEPEPTPVERPPAGASYDLRAFRHPKHGIPAVRYIYRDATGEPLHVVARYETQAGKAYAPWSWREDRWRSKMPEKPRPLYGLDRLARLTRRVVIVEGEKAADALQGVVTLSPVVTWSAGASNWRYADWEPLAGRDCLLWPDADPPGAKAMSGVAERLMAWGCRCWRIDTEGLAEGFDAADLIAQGVQGAALTAWLKERMRLIEHHDEPVEPDRVLAPGSAPGAVTIESEEPPPHTEQDIPPDQQAAAQRQAGYATAQKYALKMGRNGPHPNLSNISILLAGLIASGNAPVLWWDSFLSQVLTEEGEWSDRHTLEMLRYIQQNFDLDKVGRETVDQAVALYAWEHKRNCAQEWLTSLTWDGIERLDYLLSEGFGTPHTQYTQAVGRCFVMGMVARVLIPGCQVDNLPVFEGEQGITKSQALRILGGRWYTETMESVLSKDFYLSLAGKMLVEVAEFSSFKRAEAEAIKAAISRPTDRYRVPYERRPADHPRSCVFAATTNEHEWNLDPTGARRFWPVRCGAISLDWIRQGREQLFAEAVARVMRVPITAPAHDRIEAGAAWWSVPDELAKMEQNQRYQSDTISPALRNYLHGRQGHFTLMDVVTFGLGIDGHQRFDRGLQHRIRALLVHWGYRSEMRSIDGHPERVWFFKGKKPPDDAPEE